MPQKLKRKKNWLKSLNSAKVYEGDTEVDKFFRGLNEASKQSATSAVLLSDDSPAKVRKQAKSTGVLVNSPFMLSDTQAKALAEEAGIPWEEAYKGRVLPHWASDERVDGHGDIVMQNWDFSSFKENPAMPFNHNWQALPVGVHLSWEIRERKSEEYTGPALLLQSLYATAEQLGDSFADSLYRLTIARMLRMNSVGFSPKRVIYVEDDEERAELGLGRWGAILDDNLLLEDSPTLIGANSGALVALNSRAKKAGLTARDMTALREVNRQAAKSEEEFEENDDIILRAAEKALDISLGKDRNIETPFEIEDEVSTFYSNALDVILNEMEDEEDEDEEEEKEYDNDDSEDEEEDDDFEPSKSSESEEDEGEDSEEDEELDSNSSEEEDEEEHEDEEEEDEESLSLEDQDQDEEDEEDEEEEDEEAKEKAFLRNSILVLTERVTQLTKTINGIADTVSDSLDNVTDTITEVQTDLIGLKSLMENNSNEPEVEDTDFLDTVLERYTF